MRTLTYAFAGRGAALGAMDRLVEAGVTRRELHLEMKDGRHVLVAEPADSGLHGFAGNLLRSCGGIELPPGQGLLPERAGRQSQADEDDDWHAIASPRHRWAEEHRERAFAFGEQRSLDLREPGPDSELAREPGLRYADQDKPGR